MDVRASYPRHGLCVSVCHSRMCAPTACVCARVCARRCVGVRARAPRCQRKPQVPRAGRARLPQRGWMGRVLPLSSRDRVNGNLIKSTADLEIVSTEKTSALLLNAAADFEIAAGNRGRDRRAAAPPSRASSENTAMRAQRAGESSSSDAVINDALSHTL